MGLGGWHRRGELGTNAETFPVSCGKVHIQNRGDGHVEARRCGLQVTCVGSAGLGGGVGAGRGERVCASGGMGVGV